MKEFSTEQIDYLKSAVMTEMSFNRFRHTLGVELMAKSIGEICMPNKVDVISVAALLHDISKEYSEAEHLSLMEKHGIVMSDEDRNVPLIWHSITGPLVVMEDFPEFASEEVFSAIRNHTTGSPDMSLLDEIIFISDYIEFNRTAEDCVALRNKLLSSIEKCQDEEACIRLIHMAVVESLENNIGFLSARHRKIHGKTMLTRDAIKAKIER